ncbi:MAG: flavodoxin family protein [Planctomycetota bacterium]|jgi:FMN-dependent NADH-azoreductase
MGIKVVGIVGSYRKGKTIDNAVSAVLEGAKATGAETKKFYLLDEHIEFCTNCRSCAQEKVEARRDKCVHNDDMEGILTEIDNADAVVLGAPINLGNVTAIMKRFIERLAPYFYWPWGEKVAPVNRIVKVDKKAVTVTSSACPAFIGRILMPGALSMLKKAARIMGASVAKSLYFGPVCYQKDSQLSEKALLKAHKAGEKLALEIQPGK